MTKEQVRQKILDIGIIPVVRAKSAAQAIEISHAVCEGGIPIVEVTMTVPGAVEVIHELVHSVGSKVLVGAGTVLDTDAAWRCLDAGAKFLVSPGFDRDTVELANRQNVLIMAGGLTPTEVITAWKAGSDFVKVFPCGNVGGPSYIKALKAALPQIPMIPTGGVNLTTASQFLEAGAAALGVGGDLVSGDVTETARKYVAAVQGARR